ncbi:MAG: tetratricopeptide repeat protein, partial [Bacteroidota bacterium]|nr:tetratricopeptide repeat protein [Bacteroidota bacterium]
YYLKGANENKNDFTTPYLLLKAGWAYEEVQKFDKALEVYQQIKNDYPRSFESRDIDKYIAHIKGLQKK